MHRPVIKNRALRVQKWRQGASPGGGERAGQCVGGRVEGGVYTFEYNSCAWLTAFGAKLVYFPGHHFLSFSIFFFFFFWNLLISTINFSPFSPQCQESPTLFPSLPQPNWPGSHKLFQLSCFSFFFFKMRPKICSLQL